MPNEATNFRELLAEDVADALLGLDEFEELVTFYPAGDGLVRQVRAVLEPFVRRETADSAEYLLEEIVVFASTDRETGIPQPRLGDTLKRAHEEERYAWTGEIRSEDVAMRELIYSRRRALATGGGRRR